MLNQIVLVGRLTGEPRRSEDEKGRLQNDGPNISVIAEKVTFLSSKSSNERSDD